MLLHACSRISHVVWLEFWSAYMNRSVFSCLRTLTTWHCPHSLATRRYCNSRSTFPARRAHNSKPATAGLLLWAGGGTQRRTDMVPFLDLCSGWLGSRVVSVLDSGAEGPGFKFQPRRCRVTVLGKLFTPIMRLFTEQQN